MKFRNGNTFNWLDNLKRLPKGKMPKKFGFDDIADLLGEESVMKPKPAPGLSKAIGHGFQHFATVYHALTADNTEQREALTTRIVEVEGGQCYRVTIQLEFVDSVV